VSGPDAEFANRVRDEDHDQDANRDRGDQDEIEQLFGRALTGSESGLGACSSRKKCEHAEEDRGQERRPSEARHWLPNPNGL
jgi:hypothetical protein